MMLLVFAVLLVWYNLDVFYGAQHFIFKIETFLPQVIPAVVLLLILWLAWNKPMWGGILLIIVSFIFTYFYHSYRHLTSFLLLTAVPIIIGVLYIIVHYMKPKKLNITLSSSSIDTNL